MPAKGWKKANPSKKTLRNRRTQFKASQRRVTQPSQPVRSSQRVSIPTRFFDDDSPPPVNENADPFVNFIEENAEEFLDLLDDGDGGMMSEVDQHIIDDPSEEISSDDFDTLNCNVNENELPDFEDFEQIIQYVALMCNMTHSSISPLITRF